MYKTVLVEKAVKDGARLLEELDRRGFDVTACFWYDRPDSDRWRLVIAARIVDREGSLRAYGLLNKVKDEIGILDSFEFSISLLSPDNPTYKRIRKAIPVGDMVMAGQERNGYPGRLVSEAYIYRIEAAVHT